MYAIKKLSAFFEKTSRYVRRREMSAFISTKPSEYVHSYVSLHFIENIVMFVCVYEMFAPYRIFFFIILYFFSHKRMFELLIFTDPTLTIFNDLFTSVQFC